MQEKNIRIIYNRIYILYVIYICAYILCMCIDFNLVSINLRDIHFSFCHFNAINKNLLEI